MQEQDKKQPDSEQKNSLILQQKGEILAKHEIVSRSMAKNLIREAIEEMKKSYSPYSHFQVGSALLTTRQKIYTGCNIENAAYGATNCAERTAIFKAISEGERDFSAIAIVGGKNGVLSELCPPCGICRQVIREFVNPKSFLVILAKSEEDYMVFFLEELLPLSFGPENL
jgi:cytidine deaminase